MHVTTVRAKNVIIIAAALAGFAAMLCLVLTGSALRIDDPVREALYGIRCGALTAVMKAVTYIGNWQSVTAICLVLLIIKRTRLTYGLPLSAGALFVTLLNKLIKHVVARPRPEDVTHLVEEGGFSFASGHSVASMLVFSLLIYLIRKNFKNRTAANVLTVVLAVPMFAVGISRVYLGVHFPTDVIAGWCLGIAVTAAIAEILERKNGPAHVSDRL